MHVYTQFSDMIVKLDAILVIAQLCDSIVNTVNKLPAASVFSLGSTSLSSHKYKYDGGGMEEKTLGPDECHAWPSVQLSFKVSNPLLSAWFREKQNKKHTVRSKLWESNKHKYKRT